MLCISHLLHAEGAVPIGHIVIQQVVENNNVFVVPIGADTVIPDCPSDIFFYIMPTKIVSSKNPELKFWWIKIPRTATYAYSRLFGLYNSELLQQPKHTHEAYWQLKDIEMLPAFTVVRNPVDRFFSVLSHYLHLQERCKQGNCIYESPPCIWHSINIPTDSEQSLYEFFSEHCTSNIADAKSQMILSDTIFRTQTWYAYHPKVKIFRYENITEFNDWLSIALGYDVSPLQRVNETQPKFLHNIDKRHPAFIKTAEYLYNIDFKTFNYPLQYLT